MNRRVALAAVILTCGSLTAALSQPVSTESGLVAGAPGSDKSITVFKGIPFAAPPTGSLRWRAPEPPLKWAGTRAADRFGANCVQTIVEEKKPWTHEFMAHGDVSEDCLFLNIWTPAARPEEKHPVFVYLHGGANYEGSGSVDAYNGEGLARKGLVMITINYRLGIFGFFAHPELSKESGRHTSGDYGLLDQIAALQWVRKNIAGFGGDPERVTLAGQSAGASDISLLIASPLAKGLFQRAIMESGGAPGGGDPHTLEAAEGLGRRFAEEKNAHSLADLRALPWKDLVTTPGFRFGPVTDVAAERADVPTLAGSNADENGASPSPKITLEQFRDQAQRYGEAAAEFLKLYPASTDEEARNRANEAARDRQRVALDRWAEARARTSKTPAYLYFYNHVLPGPDSATYGAFHTSEVSYVLSSLAASNRPFTAEDRAVAEVLSSYWANFAATGDPNGKGLAHWPSVREQPAMVMELGGNSRAIPAAGSEAGLEFWRRMIPLR